MYWGLNYVPPKFTCWILTSNVTVFGDKAFIEAIRVKKIISRVGPYSDRTVVLIRRSRDESNLFLCVHRGKARWGSKEMVPPCQLRREAYWKLTKSCWLPELRFPTSRTVRKYVSIVYFFSFIFISWRLITLQYCSGFCHTLAWISHGFTYIPHPNPPSHLPLHPIPLGLPSAPAPSTCLMHPTWAGGLFHPW